MLVAFGKKILIIKAVDHFVAPRVGFLFRNYIRYSKLRTILLFLLFAFMIYGLKSYAVSNKPVNLFQKYGLTRRSTSSEVRDAYRKFARATHPDLVKSSTPHDFTQMQTELKFLTNDRSRATYDRFGLVTTSGSNDDEISRVLVRAIEIIFAYGAECTFLLIFSHTEPNYNTKNGSIIMCAVLLLLDIYYLTARASASQDPLAMIYSEFTLQERSNHLREYFLVLYFMFVTWKYALTYTWTMKARDVMNESNKILIHLQKADSPHNKPEWDRQQLKLRRILQELSHYLYFDVNANNAKNGASQQANSGPDQSNNNFSNRVSAPPQHDRKTMDESVVEMVDGKMVITSHSRYALDTRGDIDPRTPQSRAPLDEDQVRSRSRSRALTPTRDGARTPAPQPEPAKPAEEGNALLGHLWAVGKSLGGLILINILINYALKD